MDTNSVESGGELQANTFGIAEEKGIWSRVAQKPIQGPIHTTWTRPREFAVTSFDFACVQCGHSHSQQQVPFACVTSQPIHAIFAESQGIGLIWNVRDWLTLLSQTGRFLSLSFCVCVCLRHKIYRLFQCHAVTLVNKKLVQSLWNAFFQCPRKALQVIYHSWGIQRGLSNVQFHEDAPDNKQRFHAVFVWSGLLTDTHQSPQWVLTKRNLRFFVARTSELLFCLAVFWRLNRESPLQLTKEEHSVTKSAMELVWPTFTDVHQCFPKLPKVFFFFGCCGCGEIWVVVTSILVGRGGRLIKREVCEWPCTFNPLVPDWLSLVQKELPVGITGRNSCQAWPAQLTQISYDKEILMSGGRRLRRIRLIGQHNEIRWHPQSMMPVTLHA